MEPGRLLRTFGLTLFAFGAFAIITKGAITGAFLGMPNAVSITSFIFGIAFVFAGAALFMAGGRSKAHFDLEKLLKEDLSRKQVKGLSFYGKILISRHPGCCMDEKIGKKSDYHEELGKVNLMLSNFETMQSEERKKFARRYNLHEFEDKNLGKIMAVDAPKLNKAASFTGRGNLRYIFDPETKEYLGIAKHLKKGGYEWVG